MKIAVIGGAGFIGSQLVAYLREAGDDVVIYDAYLNFSKSIRQKIAFEQRRELLQDTKIVIGDIRDRLHFRDFLASEKPEVVVQLAAIAVTSARDPYKDAMIDVNLNGTIIVAEECAKADSVRRLIAASSSMAYGDFKYFCPKEDCYLEPVDLYGATKAADEMFVRYYFYNSDKEYVLLRPSAVYGPRDCNNRVVEIFVRAGLENKESITATTFEKLDFTYVEDAARAFFLATRTKQVNQVYNATTGQEHRIIELAQMVKSYFPQLQIIEKAQKEKGPERGQLDITKARQLLGFEPQYTLETGLKKYIEFEKKHA